MTRPVTVVRALAPDDRAGGSDTVIELPMSAQDRRRVRRIVDAPDGVALALELPTGTVLRPGQVLHRAGRHAYVVTAVPEDVIAVKPRDVAEAARIGHLVGNLHRDIDVDGDEIVALADDALAARFAREGIPFERRLRPFHGRAAGEHTH